LVEGKSADEIAKILRLKEVPKYMVDVRLKEGTEVIRGKLNYNAFETRTMEIKPRPTVQYFVETYDKDMFLEKTIRALP
jgi:hypothetical protein